jgi:hypothetical protein
MGTASDVGAVRDVAVNDHGEQAGEAAVLSAQAGEAAVFSAQAGEAAVFSASKMGAPSRTGDGWPRHGLRPDALAPSRHGVRAPGRGG